MTIRIPTTFIYDFANKLLREANVDNEIIENDLDSMVYEAGERNWEEEDDFFYIEWDT